MTLRTHGPSDIADHIQLAHDLLLEAESQCEDTAVRSIIFEVMGRLSDIQHEVYQLQMQPDQEK